MLIDVLYDTIASNSWVDQLALCIVWVAIFETYAVNKGYNQINAWECTSMISNQ